MHWRDYLADPALSAFVAIEEGRARMLVRRGLESAAPLLGLHDAPASVELIAGGRQAHPIVPLEDGSRAVVRGYRRGGAVRHLNRATYFGGHRAFDELRATERARAGGVRVPDVLAATERRTGIGYAASLATRLLEDAVESAAWLGSAPGDARGAMLREGGRQIGRMHAAGVAHPDLNLRNLLVASVDGEPAVWLIDFDRARLFGGPVPGGRRASDLRRLARSARKLGVALGEAGWQAMRQGYGAGGWPLPEGETRSLAG